MTPHTGTPSVERTFFISGSGRSGTQWLSALLRESPNAFIQHEWHKLRYGALEPLHNKTVGLPYRPGPPAWEAKRLRATRKAIADCGKEVYGECGNKTRYSLPMLERAFDPVFLLQLVRDGRDVVRSFYSRQTYTGHDLHPPLEPGPRDPYRHYWASMDRFEKLCWLWSFTTEMVDFYTFGNYVRFEDLLNMYHVLQSKILVPASMTVSPGVWQSYTERRIDKSHMSFRLPHWTEWDKQRTALFWSICGDTMVQFNYG